MIVPVDKILAKLYNKNKGKCAGKGVLSMEQSNSRARRRPVQPPAGQAKKTRAKQRVRIEENGYRAPAKLVQAIKSVNWCRVVLCIAAVYAVVSIGLKVLTIFSQKSAQAALLEEQAALEQQVEELEKQQNYVGTEEYIEQAARDKFGWVKGNEIVFKKKDAAE